MALRVLETEAVAEDALPVEALAAQLRLPDGWDTVPGDRMRIVGRLGAALEAIERRVGRMILSRLVILGGRTCGRSLVLPVGPITDLVSVEVDRGTGWVGLPGAALAAGLFASRVVLPYPLAQDLSVRVTVRAGHSDWGSVPGDLGQAVLHQAEALERGEEASMARPIAELIAPFRRVRLGGADL